jgi:hypothetical protein
MTTNIIYEPTEKELEMLNHYQELIGFRWKSKILGYWELNPIPAVAYAPQLRSLRKVANEAWLKKFSLDKANAKASAEKPPVVVTFQVVCTGDAFAEGGVHQLLTLFNAAAKSVAGYYNVSSLDGHEVKLSDENGNICASLTAKRVGNDQAV